VKKALIFLCLWPVVCTGIAGGLLGLQYLAGYQIERGPDLACTVAFSIVVSGIIALGGYWASMTPEEQYWVMRIDCYAERLVAAQQGVSLPEPEQLSGYWDSETSDEEYGKQRIDCYAERVVPAESMYLNKSTYGVDMVRL